MAGHVGIIGLGQMGAAIATALRAAGFDLTVFDVRDDAMAPHVAQGARAARSPREVAEAVTLVGLVVNDDEQVEAVLDASDGVLGGAREGAVVAIHSTVLPATVVRLAATAAERGVTVFDAPVTGGIEVAAEGKLCVMVGGDADGCAPYRPVLDAMADTVVDVGPLGSGAALKLCNNMLSYAGFLAVAEASRLALGAGVRLEALERVGLASGNLNPPMSRYLAGRRHSVPAEYWTPRARHARALADKDLSLTLALAESHGVELPGVATCRRLLASVFPDAPPETE